ncbi:hypothetical protein WDZ92_52405, partial [Nostoc sp. NIES-2111]
MDEAFLFFGADLPNREFVLSTYIEAAVALSVGQDEAAAAYNAIASLRAWGLLDAPEAGAAWLNYGKLLH